MTAPLPNKELLVFLTASAEAIGVLIAQEQDEVEKPVYYLSRLLKGPEQNHSMADKLCTALMYAVQKLRHYMLTHKDKVTTNLDPIKLILQKPILTAKYAK
ncbi:hypothetical protein TorRG33x02_275310 [Trema orientale]|uniref:Reverse transcriptase RNase H-like domain-containing protein n=1 Tax=Trema orientale TaxID=63057 RepID=A0A2P5CS14_TREOI|nr:hypothetical protein TorRG33x02_275310 [Trema orientale]